jgi:hypothetical protein
VSGFGVPLLLFQPRPLTFHMSQPYGRSLGRDNIGYRALPPESHLLASNIRAVWKIGELLSQVNLPSRQRPRHA